MNIVYDACPVCSNKDIRFLFPALDHTVSSQSFEIWQCNNCSLRFTQYAPSPDKIGAFYQSENYISHTDTTKGFINQLYHRVRKSTLVSKRKLIEHVTRNDHGNILDIGAGTGSFLHTMKKAGWQVTGLEPDVTAKAKAMEMYNIELHPSAQLFQLPAESFNAITMWHVLEHVHDLDSYIEQLKKLLKPDGYILIAVPNYTCYDEKVYKEFWAAYDVPRHLYHFSPEAMVYLASKHGLNLKSVKAMWYDSFYVSMLSEQYKGKGNIMKAFFTGLISDCKALLNHKKASSLIYILRKY
ncbi:MAG: class I SAM-dependent methyltransferase [Ginsengibacter sp.]